MSSAIVMTRLSRWPNARKSPSPGGSPPDGPAGASRSPAGGRPSPVRVRNGVAPGARHANRVIRFGSRAINIGMTMVQSGQVTRAHGADHEEGDRSGPPPLPPHAIDRDRVASLLDVVFHQRLTIVIAPPGYGKTV